LLLVVQLDSAKNLVMVGRVRTDAKRENEKIKNIQLASKLPYLHFEAKLSQKVSRVRPALEVTVHGRRAGRRGVRGGVIRLKNLLLVHQSAGRPSKFSQNKHAQETYQDCPSQTVPAESA
jgi:hypothetical protein